MNKFTLRRTLLRFLIAIIFFVSAIIKPVSAQTKELWGTTSSGGQYGAGVILKTDGSGNNEAVQNFPAQNDGVYPIYTNLIQASDGNLYGMTGNGGANNLGVLFQYNPVTSSYTKKLDFNGATNGAQPNGSLMQASDGNLYGMTDSGGINNKGAAIL